MTPASVFLRTLAAAALLLPAAGLRADDPAPGSLDVNFPITNATVYAISYEIDPADGTVKITSGGDRGYAQYLVFPPDNGPSPSFVFAAFGNVARNIFTIVPERAPVVGNTLPDLLIGGQFDGGFGRNSDNKPIQNIKRIAPLGDIDQDFSNNVGTGANNFVTAILPLNDGTADNPVAGRIVVGGLFTKFNRQPRRRIVRLLNNGQIDPSFATGSNIDNDVLALAEGIEQAAPGQPGTGQIDGSTIVGGAFNHVAGQAYGKLVRLDPNGNLDLSFHPSIDLRVLAILVQDDGKIIIGGDFTNVNGTRVSRLARLNYDGSLDTTFVGSVSGVPNNDVNPTAVNVLRRISDARTAGGQIADGRIYVGGEFAQINGAPRQYLGLITADGALDLSFNPNRTIFNAVQSLAIQSDNKVLVGETLGPRVNGQFPPSFIRLIGVVPTAP